MEPTLVVFSGGQDSTICLLQAIAERGAVNVNTITFDYGQRHKLEVTIAESLAKELGVASHKTVAVDWYKDITHNALMDTTTPIGKEAGATCPNTFVDGRNALFLLAAAIYAKGLGIRDLTIGSCAEDVYPDNTVEFIGAMGRTLRLALNWPIQILAPLKHLTKEQEWELADRLGRLDFVRTKTLTCYEGVPGDGCGRCKACRSRAAGLEAYLRNRKPPLGTFAATIA